MRIFYFLFIFSEFFFVSAIHAKDNYSNNSVLSQGKWVKLKLSSPNPGIYKIMYDDLRKMGFSDPEKVSVYGYGGWALDENFKDSSAYIDDIPATAIYRGENYLLFYGKGYIKWMYDTTSATFIHTNNPYATNSYYFLTDEYNSKVMEKESSVDNATKVFRTFDDYRLHEKEIVSPNKSGRELYGESFVGETRQTISTSSEAFNIPGITNEPAKVTMRFIAHPIGSAGTATLKLDEETVIDDLTIKPIGSNEDDSYTVAKIGSKTAIWKGEKSEKTRAVVSYSNSGDANVYLDYVSLQVKRELKIYGSYTFFRCIDSREAASRFVISGADANTLIFDVTNGSQPKQMETKLNGSELSFTIPIGSELREFVAVQSNQTLGGWAVEQNPVTNQNLHSIQQADMVIISPSAFLSQAERLAERHRTDNDPLTVTVVTPEQIYNEFSSGTPDATAYRRFMKMFYDRNEQETDKPKYLLLFGDGAYDNRHLTSDWKNIQASNLLLTYQSQESLNYYTFVSDDYFGALKNESFGYGAIQVGIGRIPIQTLSQATIVVNKIIAYMNNQVTGAWKNRLAFVADDGSKLDNFSTQHINYADSLTKWLNRNHPEFSTNKIYFDYYKKQNGTYEDVRRNIVEQLNEGLLLVNYTGHGSAKKWADEDVLNKEMIAGFHYRQLPLWITATCDFTRFDDTETSAGEDIFLSSSGGIALFTTTRMVDSHQNFDLNEKLIQHLFDRDIDGKRLTLGLVMRNTKGSLYDDNKLNFVLIGDPAMKLTYPEYKIRINTINGRQADGDPIPLKAQEKITISGEIQNLSGNLEANFSGLLDVTVFDSKQHLKTLDNNGKDRVYAYDAYPNTMIRLNSTVAAGMFEFSFVVPKDISYSEMAGLINLYAYDKGSGNEAQGSYQNFTVGGSFTNYENDTEGPEIRMLYLNDSTFIDGGHVNATPFFVARLWDETGVNISGSSVGHDITLIIDNPTVYYNLNNYYKLLPETDGEGLITFPVPELTPGIHYAEFNAWDVFNNPTRHEFTFVVEKNMKPQMIDVIATPVPARDHIQFKIYHNRPESNMQVSLMVFDMAGHLVWKQELQGVSEWNTPLVFDWDLCANGGRLRGGIYIYQAAIRSENSKEATKAKKFIILAQ